MSHFVKSRVEIKDLAKLKVAAENLGLEVIEAKAGERLIFRSPYAGEVDAQMIFRHKNGECAVVDDGNGNYRTLIDNYHNPIVSKVGNDCETLCRDYATEILKAKTMLMGGSIASQTIDQKGNVELRIQIY